MTTLEQMQWDEMVHFLTTPPLGKDYRVDECWSFWLTDGGKKTYDEVVQELLKEMNLE